MLSRQRLLLIGGASHVGKSTLAQCLASHLNWNCYSTDKLARHPGRPWQVGNKDIPSHVAKYYELLSADELAQDTLRHYRDTVWPTIENIVAFHANETLSEKVVMEGSALLPDLVETLGFDNISAIWLTASNIFLKQRIHCNSQYGTKSLNEKLLIDKFLERNNLFNRQIVKAVHRLGLASLNVEDESTLDSLKNICLSSF